MRYFQNIMNIYCINCWCSYLKARKKGCGVRLGLVVWLNEKLIWTSKTKFWVTCQLACELWLWIRWSRYTRIKLTLQIKKRTKAVFLLWILSYLGGWVGAGLNYSKFENDTIYVYVYLYVYVRVCGMFFHKGNSSRSMN